ncbi:MAG: DUF1818 family protein [Nodosilinea sp. LVE1205-7]|jgi:hypothetical protein
MVARGERVIQEGNGWRLGWDATASDYPALLAGEGWALELTALEFKDFCRLAQELAATLETMAQVLMEQEQVTCELESEYIWLEAEGFPDQYCLRFILQTGRRGEGQWQHHSSREVVAAIAVLASDQLQLHP